jgi:acyl-coenzyme A thioesterase PaaI-like protein
MKQKIQNPFPDNNCFFCGSENAEGLKLTFDWDEDRKEAYSEYVPAEHFAGAGNILHGGIQTGILDEIMGWTSYAFTHEMAVTSGLALKFLKPVYICGEKIDVRCRVISKEGPEVNMEAILSNSEGDICTTATGTFHILPSDKYKDLIQGNINTPDELSHSNL